MSENYTVYMHTCPNGKRYVGITQKEPDRRWENGYGYRAQMFGRAIEKYGWESIFHEILLTGLSKAEAEKREQFYIALFRTVIPEFGYNCTSGGNLGKRLNEAARRKISEKNSGENHPMFGKHHSDETKAKLRMYRGDKSPNYGRVLSAETRLKMSAARTGRKTGPHSEETKRKIGEGNKGKIVSEETRRKLSESRKGKPSPLRGVPRTEETIEKMSAAFKERYLGEGNPFYGKNHSEESIRKMKAAKRSGSGRSVVNLDTGEVFGSIAEAVEKYNAPHIGDCATGRCKTSGGYHWAYCERDDSGGKV